MCRFGSKYRSWIEHNSKRVDLSFFQLIPATCESLHSRQCHVVKNTDIIAICKGLLDFIFQAHLFQFSENRVGVAQGSQSPIEWHVVADISPRQFEISVIASMYERTSPRAFFSMFLTSDAGSFFLMSATPQLQSSKRNLLCIGKN